MSRFPPDIGNRGANRSANRWADRWHQGHVMALAALLAPIVAVVAPLGLAPVLGVCAAAMLALRRARTGAWFSRPTQATVAVGALFAWILASYFWSIDTNAFIDKIPRLFGVLIAGVIFLDASFDLDVDAKRLVRRMLVIGIAVGLTLLLVDRIGDGPLRRLISLSHPDRNLPIVFFNRTVTALALLIWPAALVIWRRRPAVAITVWTVSFALIVSFESNAAIVGLVVGTAVFALVFWRPRRAALAIGLALAALVLVSPLMIRSWISDRTALKQQHEMITNSGYHRLLIWSFVAEKIAERPLLGWGFNSSRSIPGADRDLDSKIGAPALPLHPHNASLQLWLELGLPGAALGAILIGGIMIRLGRMATERIDKAASAALVLGIVTIGNLSYGAWQSWWLAAIWLSAGFMVVAIEWPAGETDRAR